MFMAARFTVAVTWKQPKCPLTEEKDKEDMAPTHEAMVRLSHKKVSLAAMAMELRLSS